MAGRGSRFSEKGFVIPKPFISVLGKPIFQWALESIFDLHFSKLILVALRDHADQFQITKYIPEQLKDRTEIILLESPTEGQLCTVLACKNVLDENDDLLIISSDTYVKSNLNDSILHQKPDTRGIISVANLPGDRWSFAKPDHTGRVVEVAEKIRISDFASTGLYYFRFVKDIISIGEEMVIKKETHKGEYYIIPVYQKMIQRGDYIGISKAEEIIDLGTPEALADFIKKNERD
ncbi:MAG: NTP transferase domain-containing protein [Cyclobacteriaceae bacterium]|nr:NTP transferase domain-containing protein [Cyclobacteriaceae bacterium]